MEKGGNEKAFEGKATFSEGFYRLIVEDVFFFVFILVDLDEFV